MPYYVSGKYYGIIEEGWRGGSVGTCPVSPPVSSIVETSVPLLFVVAVFAWHGHSAKKMASMKDIIFTDFKNLNEYRSRLYLLSAVILAWQEAILATTGK